MARVSRDEYLDVAETLFAERGFYGVSIAAIAADLGLTKQALLHHFGSKEKLYGEVLKRISKDFESIASRSGATTNDAEAGLRTFFRTLRREALAQTAQTRLLFRELLDNNQRAETVSAWYLKAFLENLIAMIQSLPNWQDGTMEEALTAGYQLLGAINYYAISKPTLSGIFGPTVFNKLDDRFPDQLEVLVDAVIQGPPKR